MNCTYINVESLEDNLARLMSRLDEIITVNADIMRARATRALMNGNLDEMLACENVMARALA